MRTQLYASALGLLVAVVVSPAAGGAVAQGMDAGSATPPVSGAQETAARPATRDDRQDAPRRKLEEMTGVTVFNALDEEIGEIAGYIVEGDRILYARVEFGGFLGFGGEEVSVPFAALNFRPVENGGGGATLEAVIETVRTTDELRGLMRERK